MNPTSAVNPNGSGHIQVSSAYTPQLLGSQLWSMPCNTSQHPFLAMSRLLDEPDSLNSKPRKGCVPNNSRQFAQ